MDAESTKSKILQLIDEPKRYTEIMRTLGITDKTIQRHLNDLRESGLITKNEEGLYVLTEKGRLELVRIRLLQESYEMAKFVEKDSDIEIMTNAKIALALKKTLTFLFDARYLKKNHPEKFNVDLNKLSEHAEIIKRLLMKYDPWFDIMKEERDEEKYIRWYWGEHVPPFSQFSKWIWKKWFSRAENVVSLIETLPSGDVRNEIVSALREVCKVMKGLGLDTTLLEARLNKIMTSTVAD